MGGIKAYYPKDLPLTAEQENKVVAEADAAYLAAKASGQEIVCPYRRRTYANEIWSTRLIDAPLVLGHSNDDFEVLGPGAPFMSFTGFTMGKDAHETREAAVVASEAACKKKVAALKKQIAKLEATKF